MFLKQYTLQQQRGFLASIAIIIGALSRSKQTTQYTRWNLVFLCLHRYIGLSTQSVFVNSVTTLIAFQHGATNGAKSRLMDRAKIARPSLFLLADSIGHVLPMMLTGHLMFTGKGGQRLRIEPAHLLHVYTWIGLYYALVAKSLNCERQYVVYPWRRQVLSCLGVPLLLRMAWNRDARRTGQLSCTMLGIGVFYLKEWYDLTDYRAEPVV
jgi:hypothetical protein